MKNTYDKFIETLATEEAEQSKGWLVLEKKGNLTELILSLEVPEHLKNEMMDEQEREKIGFYNIGFKEGFETAIAKMLLK